MGQRLVVDIRENSKSVCNCYFHWSAYTMAAFWTLKDLSDLLGMRESSDNLESLFYTERAIDTQLKIIRACEYLGGGVAQEDLEYARKKYPWYEFKENISRNDGIVAITEKSMAENESYSEGDAHIDVVKKTCGNDCFYFEDSYDDLMENYMPDNTPEEKDIPNTKYDPGDIRIEGLDKVIEYYKENGPILKTSGGYLVYIE